jgi:hypothetical protein
MVPYIIDQLIIDLQPFTHDFPRADVYDMISPDMLHQLIKGVFKDHLVTWVGEYLLKEHGETRANEILDDIDRRYVTVSPISSWHMARALGSSNLQ